MTAETVIGAAAGQAAEFRTCQYTGLRSTSRRRR